MFSHDKVIAMLPIFETSPLQSSNSTIPGSDNMMLQEFIVMDDQCYVSVLMMNYVNDIWLLFSCVVQNVVQENSEIMRQG